jgi:hypothetical protein
LAGWNGVPDVSIEGCCGAQELEAALNCPGENLVICDIEGAEAELLDPAKVPQLALTWMLVEMHDAFRPDVSALLRQRFSKSHCIKEVQSTLRHWYDFPGRRSAATFLPRSLALRAMEKGRPPQSWFWMQPIQRKSRMT